jgi:hypothetical protein
LSGSPVGDMETNMQQCFIWSFKLIGRQVCNKLMEELAWNDWKVVNFDDGLLPNVFGYNAAESLKNFNFKNAHTNFADKYVVKS